MKAAFLIQLASGCRGSWLHACKVDPVHLRKENGGFHFLPALVLDKNQSPAFFLVLGAANRGPVEILVYKISRERVDEILSNLVNSSLGESLELITPLGCRLVLGAATRGPVEILLHKIF